MTTIKYKNGGYNVSIDSKTGTKVRERVSDDPPTQPESMDIKITDYCDLHNMCKWCHEGSDINGKHADLDLLRSKLFCLQKGTELAIGGGNPLTHQDLIPFLIEVGELGLIANLTINEYHINKSRELITYLIENKLVYGLGVTYSGKFDISWLHELSDNVVYHMIAGIHNVHDIAKLPKALVLGYKQVRKGKSYFSTEVESNIKSWFMYLRQYIGKNTISFDNLAIDQLNIKRFMTDESWSEFYMGDDGTMTYYIDAVKQEFSSSSTDLNRKSYLSNCIEMFKDVTLTTQITD